MIIDILGNWHLYSAVSTRLDRALQFLECFSTGAELGRQDISGDNAFALVQKVITTPLKGRQYEVHRKYIDVQYVHSGREVLHWAPLSTLSEPATPFDLI